MIVFLRIQNLAKVLRVTNACASECLFLLCS